jgi:hypothetical protein
MWHAPFSFDFHSNWMGFAISREGFTSSSRQWFDKMYGRKTISEFSTCSVKKYNNNVEQLCVCGDHFEICGTMGTSHKPDIKIEVRPRREEDFPQTLRDELNPQNN